MRFRVSVLRVFVLGVTLLGGCADDPCQGLVCRDYNDCTEDTRSGCDCRHTPVAEGTMCAGGTCQAGACELTDTAVPCSEQGIRNAIAAGGDEPYTFDCDGPQTVVIEESIGIGRDVILDGEGNLTVDGDGEHTVFYLPDDLYDISAELRKMTITGGGDGVSNGGTLTLTNVVVERNNGSGIRNGGTLTLNGSAVTDNTSGGIINWSTNGGRLTLNDSTVSGNTTSDLHGGGIFHVGGTLTLNNSVVSGNHGISGGGIATTGNLTLTNSTVSGNSAEEDGGGIAGGGLMTVTNSTISGNIAADRGDGIFGWGGISIPGVIEEDPARLTMTGTVVDGDCAGDPEAEILSNGYNLESDGDTCGFDQETDQVEVTAEQLNLGPLRDNGGPTMTHALLTEPTVSVAIDAIPAGACEVESDQRGEERPAAIVGAEPSCDVGAFEAQP